MGRSAKEAERWEMGRAVAHGRTSERTLRTGAWQQPPIKSRGLPAEGDGTERGPRAWLWARPRVRSFPRDAALHAGLAAAPEVIGHEGTQPHTTPATPLWGQSQLGDRDTARPKPDRGSLRERSQIHAQSRARGEEGV